MANSVQGINATLQSSNEKSEPPRIGSEIFGQQTRLTCTCGGLVVVEDKIGILTAAHGVLPRHLLDLLDFNRMKYVHSSDRSIHVYHPAPPSPDASLVGTVTRACFRSGKCNEVSIDAAFVELSDQNRVPMDGYMTRQTQGQLHRAGKNKLIEKYYIRRYAIC